MSQKMDAGRSIIQVNTRIVDTFDEATAQSLFALFIKNGTWQPPTLSKPPPAMQLNSSVNLTDEELLRLARSLILSYSTRIRWPTFTTLAQLKQSW